MNDSHTLEKLRMNHPCNWHNCDTKLTTALVVIAAKLTKNGAAKEQSQ
jgi:hypothetical protein